MADGGDSQAKTSSAPKIKHDFYQSETHVTINILAKNTKPDEVKVHFGEQTLDVTAQLPDGSQYELKLNLAFPIIPAQSSYKVKPSKIEVSLKKRDGIRWTCLERDPSVPLVPQPMAEVAVVSSGPPKYPSSAPKAKDWDRMANEIDKEEEEEKPAGDAALNQLFQKIYSEGNDEVKRAMNKSFQESGGTVLSTNWNEVGRDKVDVKAPDGMEWKKWDQ